MKKLLVLCLLVFSSHSYAASQLNRSQAKVVGAIIGAYSGALVGTIGGAVIGAVAGDAKSAAIGGLIGLPVGTGLGALLGSWIGGSGYPDEEDARYDFHRRVFAHRGAESRDGLGIR